MTERPQAFAFAFRLQNTKQNKNSSERSIYFGRHSKPRISRGKCIRGIRVVKWTNRSIKLNRNDYSNECVTCNSLYGNSLVNSKLTNSVGVRSFGAFFFGFIFVLIYPKCLQRSLFMRRCALCTRVIVIWIWYVRRNGDTCPSLLHLRCLRRLSSPH